jgi:hypothetical protein
MTQPNGYDQIWTIPSHLDPMPHVHDPAEPVLPNQITPRVGFWFKQNFELEIQTRFDPNLAKIISSDL